MAKISYTKDGNKKSLLSLTERITTPSIKLVGPGGTFYTPLFNSTAATVDKDRYRYTLSNFKVGNYRAAESRSFINSAPTATLSASATRAPNGTYVTLTCNAADPDGDTLTDFCYYTKVNGTWDSGSHNGTSIDVSGSYITKEFYVVVTDRYGASVTSNHVTVTWYYHAPVIRLKNFPDRHDEGAVSFDIEYGDAEHHDCTIEYGYVTQENTSFGMSWRRTGSVDVSTPNNVSDSNYGQTINVTVPRTYYFFPMINFDQSIFHDGRRYTTNYCVVYARIIDKSNGKDEYAYGRYEYVKS